MYDTPATNLRQVQRIAPPGKMAFEVNRENDRIRGPQNGLDNGNMEISKGLPARVYTDSNRNIIAGLPWAAHEEHRRGNPQLMV